MSHKQWTRQTCMAREKCVREKVDFAFSSFHSLVQFSPISHTYRVVRLERIKWGDLLLVNKQEHLLLPNFVLVSILRHARCVSFGPRISCAIQNQLHIPQWISSMNDRRRKKNCTIKKQQKWIDAQNNNNKQIKWKRWAVTPVYHCRFLFFQSLACTSNCSI